MNRLVVSLVLSTFAFAANAQTQTQTNVSGQNASAEVTVVTGDPAKTDDRHCLRETGSHISSRNKHKKACNNAIGRSYTREDLDRTGTTDLADALRRLDPAISVHN